MSPFNIEDLDDKIGGEIPKECVEGGDAFGRGLKEADNPYPVGSKQHEDWELGWCNAEGYDQYTKGEIP